MKLKLSFSILELFLCLVLVLIASVVHACPSSCSDPLKCVEKCGDVVYTAGGTNLNKVRKWDKKPRNDTYANSGWTDMKPMTTPRRDFALVHVNGWLYAIGGNKGSFIEKIDLSDPNAQWYAVNESHPSIEKIDPQYRNNCGIFGMSTAVLESKIHVIGGKIKCDDNNSTHADAVVGGSCIINTANDDKIEDQPDSPPGTPRYHAVAKKIKHGEKAMIYLFGGCTENGNSSNLYQRYDGEKMEWKNIDSPKSEIQKPARASIIDFENYLYFFEKYSCNETEPAEKHIFPHVYNITGEKWIDGMSLDFGKVAKWHYPIWIRPSEYNGTLHVLRMSDTIIDNVNNTNLTVDNFSSTVLVRTPNFNGVDFICNGSGTTELEQTVLCKWYGEPVDEFILESNNKWEGQLMEFKNDKENNLLEQKINNESKLKQFYVQGKFDGELDGDKSYCIKQKFSKDCILNFINKHVTFPIIESMNQSQIPLQGKNIEVTGRRFHPNIKVQMGTFENGVFVGEVVNHTFIGTSNYTVQDIEKIKDLEKNEPNNFVESLIDKQRTLNVKTPNSSSFINKTWAEKYVTIILTNPDNGRSAIPCKETNRWDETFCWPGQKNSSMQNKQQFLYYTDPCKGKINVEGFYGSGNECQECPPGLFCPGGKRAWPEKGWWKFPDDEISLQVWPCTEPSTIRCKGHTDGNWDDQCGTGYTGMICARCEENYYLDTHECKSCKPDVTSYVGVFLTAGIFFGAIIILIGWGSISQMEQFTFFLVGLQQVIEAIRSASWSLPESFKDFINLLKVIALDYSFTRPDCIGSSNLEYSQYFLIVVVCFLCFVLFSILCALVYQFRHREAVEENWICSSGRNFRVKRALISSMHWSYLQLATVSAKVMNCADINGRSTLVIEPSTQCFTGSHVYAFVAALFVFGVLLAFPTYWAYSLHKLSKERRLNDKEVRETWSFLLYGIRNECYWFRVFPFFISMGLAWSATLANGAPNASYISAGTIFLWNVVVVVAFWPMATDSSNIKLLAWGLVQSGILNILLWVQLSYGSQWENGSLLAATIILNLIQVSFMIFALIVQKSTRGHPWVKIDELEMMQMKVTTATPQQRNHGDSIQVAFGTVAPT